MSQNKNEEFTIKLLVEYSMIFDEPPKDLRTYLNGISRTVLLTSMTFFLGFANRNSKFEEFKDFLEMFFCEENNQLANQIYSKLSSYRQARKAEPIIINPYTSLQIFEFCFNELGDENTQSNAEAEVNILKAILFVNEQNTILQNKAFESTKNVHIDLIPGALWLAQSFSYSDLINYNLTEIVACQMIKSIYFFEFLENNNQTKILLDEFLKYFKCPNWKYFLRRYLPFASSVIMANRESHIDVSIERGEEFENSCNFIEKLIITDEETIRDYDFRKIRAKPFYKISDGVYRIIFGLFVVELLHKGLFFKLTEINDKLENAKKVKGNFRSFYCGEFSEKFLLYKTLNSIYENRYVEFSGAELQALNVVGEPDYYIRKGNAVFLFESKDILINATIKSTYDFEQYETELKKKLYFDLKNEKVDKKAVLQLLDNIENILTKQLSFDVNYKTNSVYIYPIIVLHDNQFNVPGLNVLVNHWFKKELEKLKVKGINIDRVQPITIINIDAFLFYQDLLRNRTIKLETILDEYFKFTTFDNKKKYRDEDHAQEFLYRTILPFSTFLGKYISDKNLKQLPAMFKEKSMQLFT
jgi:hypothetical protein